MNSQCRRLCRLWRFLQVAPQSFRHHIQCQGRLYHWRCRQSPSPISPGPNAQHSFPEREIDQIAHSVSCTDSGFPLASSYRTLFVSTVLHRLTSLLRRGLQDVACKVVVLHARASCSRISLRRPDAHRHPPFCSPIRHDVRESRCADRTLHNQPSIVDNAEHAIGRRKLP